MMGNGGVREFWVRVGCESRTITCDHVLFSIRPARDGTQPGFVSVKRNARVNFDSLNEPNNTREISSLAKKVLRIVAHLRGARPGMVQTRVTGNCHYFGILLCVSFGDRFQKSSRIVRPNERRRERIDDETGSDAVLLSGADDGVCARDRTGQRSHRSPPVRARIVV